LDFVGLFRFFRAAANAVLCRRRVSVCLSVTSRCSTETAKRRITQITPDDRARTLVFWRRRSQQNSNGGAKCSWSRLKWATFDK